MSFPNVNKGPKLSSDFEQSSINAFDDKLRKDAIDIP